MSRVPVSKSQSSGLSGQPRSSLLDLVDEIGGPDKLVTAFELVVAAKARGIKVTWPDIYGLYRHYPLRRTESFLIPTFLTEFIGAYIKDRNAQSILDPWVGIGSLLLPIAEAGNVSRAVGIGQNTREIQLAQAMSTRPVEWLNEKPDAALDKLGTFDLIVSSPPLGLRPVSEKFQIGEGTVEVRDSETHVLALKSATHLSEDGEAIFILPNSFFFSRQSASVREALPTLGLHVRSIIALPTSVFASLTSIELNLVFISRQKADDVFVGQLSPDRDPTPLLRNLQKRKPGPAPELGRLVRLEEYRGWRSLAAGEEERRLAERSGLQSVQLRDLVEAVNLGKQTEDGGFANLSNCVYLPLIGTSAAVSSLAELKIKPQNYAQLVVREGMGYADFLAGFFNSPLGRKVREAMLSGGFIPKITRQSILQATAYTLPVDSQKKATDVTREIQELRLRLEQLERDLWSRPVDAARVRKAVNALNQKEGFEAWLETLPFPLASILWRYQAASSAEHKCIHLLNYFEAAAQFLGTLMASAFHSNPPFFREHRHDWFESGKENLHSLARSAFGEWVVRCQRLAKSTRQMLSNKEQKDLGLDLYRITDDLKLEAVAHKAVYGLLETISRYRNDWKGHTGIISAKEHDRRLGLLQEELTRLRGLIGGAFEEWWLIRPGKNSFAGGIYHYSAEKLMGSRQIFKQIELETTDVMDSNELYFFDTTTRRPLQVLHFFRMMPVPESEEVACYFYNRLEKDGVRWVSYHFEGKADRIEPDASVVRIIEEIEQENG